MEELAIPENFKSIINDFTNDLSITFPEYSYLWQKWRTSEISDLDLSELFQFCVKVYPERFFDILYQKEEIFHPNDDTNVDFLPNVSFKLLYSCENVSEQTKKIIWKYLQLVLFTIVGGVKDKNMFGDAAGMFENLGEGELHDKMSEVMGGINDFFQKMDFGHFAEPPGGSKWRSSEDPHRESYEDNFDNFSQKETSPEPEDDETTSEPEEEDEMKKTFQKMGLPDISKLQEHLKTLFDGKIGKLAKEMAEEISEEFSDLLGKDAADVQNPQDVIKKLMKDPKKLMEMMKTVGSKLDNKMKSGEISKEELMKEASEMMNKMKEMGGTDQFNEMFKNMAKNMGAMGKNMKMDTNALDRMTKMTSTKDRMRAKVEQKKQQKELDQAQELANMKKRLDEQEKLLAKYSLESKGANNLVFKLDGEDAQEKSFIHPDLLKEIAEEEAKKNMPNEKTSTNKKKKKGKK